MSKHSIRIGSAGSDERLAQPVERLGSALAPPHRRALLLERERRIACASSRIRRFSPRSAARTSTRAPRRSPSASATSLGRPAPRRRSAPAPPPRRVVLQQELLEHLRARALEPRWRDRTTGGLRARRRAPGRPARWPPCPTARRRRRRACRPRRRRRAGARAASARRQAVALDRRLLELLRRGSGAACARSRSRSISP